jgi:hypothetical protein
MGVEAIFCDVSPDRRAVEGVRDATLIDRERIVGSADLDLRAWSRGGRDLGLRVRYSLGVSLGAALATDGDTVVGGVDNSGPVILARL